MSTLLRCPCCARELTHRMNDSVGLDICLSGCGGVWFDGGELDRCDEEHEFASPEAMRALKNKAVVVDDSAKRPCPRCNNQELKREFFDTQYAIEVDRCAGCKGIWLDLGELEQVRSQIKTEEERNSIIEKWFKKNAKGKGLEQLPKGVLAVLKVMF